MTTVAKANETKIKELNEEITSYKNELEKLSTTKAYPDSSRTRKATIQYFGSF
jgi:hypothetical protein